MKKKAQIMVLVILSFAAVVQSGARAAAFPEMKLQLAHVNPRTDDDHCDIYARLFAEKVMEGTGGAVVIEIFGNGQLGGERDVIEGLRMGTIDVAIQSNNSISAVHDKSFIIELPFLWRDQNSIFDFLETSINREISDSVYANLDINILGWAEGGFRNVVNNIRPIIVPADMKGVKIRVPESPIFVDTFQALGANPTPVAFAETYTAIQQGTVDGLELPVPSVYASRYYEICKYYSMTRHFFNAIAMCVSRSLYESMNEDLRQVFIRAAREAGIAQRKILHANAQRQLAEMAKEGLDINDNIDFDAMQQTVRPIYEKYRSVIGEELFDRAMAEIAKHNR